MARRRMPRVNEQLKREITELIRHEARDPRIGLATVTSVSAAPDLSFARVFVSIHGDDEAKQQTLEGLRAAAPWVRGELGKRMRVRRVPELRFELDLSLDYALRIERLLAEVKSDAERADSGDDATDRAADDDA